jgi:hypothetical protein
LFEEHGKLPSNTADTGASRRIRPGTKAEDMAEGPPLIELQDIDSAFQLTEHLKALHYHHTNPPDTDSTTPITTEIAKLLSQPPPGTAREIWLYELGRFLIQKTNAIIVALFADTPPCSPQTCSEMRASEWQYLCAVHDPPKSCAAIDYCCHTLDWAATTLTSSKMFPSRLNLGSGAAGHGADKMLQSQMKELTNIFRRVYRIYAHAWFQHREMFWRVEGKTGLYILFKTVCDDYGLIQAENYTIPPEAEGIEPKEEERKNEQQISQVLARPTVVEEEKVEPVGNTVSAAGDTTKRHRHTLSDRAPSVTTVIREEDDVELRKPDLQRQATELKHFAESLPQPGQQQQAQPSAEPEQEVKENVEDVKEEEGELAGSEAEPAVGVKRSDTVKPQKQTESDQSEAQDEVETTVVEVEPDAKAPVEESAEQTDAKVEIMEPQEAKAADPEEAGKSVAD